MERKQVSLLAPSKEVLIWPHLSLPFLQPILHCSLSSSQTGTQQSHFPGDTPLPEPRLILSLFLQLPPLSSQPGDLML
jgi:hypothetical protein